MIRVFICAAVLFFWASAALAGGGAVTLGWEPNTEHDLAGYRVHYKTGSGGPPYSGKGLDQGDSPVTVKLTDLDPFLPPRTDLTGLELGVTYFFTLTAFDTGGNESEHSNEVNCRVSGDPGGDPDPPPKAPAVLNVIKTAILNDTKQ